MLVIYDQNGTIVTQNTKKEEIVGNLNFMDVTEVEGKILNRVNVKVTPHAPIFVDIPKSPIEILQEQHGMMMMLLANKDKEHDLGIQDLKYKLDKLDMFVKNNVTPKEVK